MSIFFALLLAAQTSGPAQDGVAPASPPAAPVCTPSSAPPSSRIRELIAARDGTTAERAWRVRSVREEYQIVDALGLCPRTQSLTTQGRRPYDVLRVIDPRTGAERDLWFDISAFFGRW